MTVIQGTALDSGQSPIAHAQVRITLVTGTPTMPGYTAAGELIGPHPVLADTNGVWSIDLVPNSQITPPNTYYQVTEANGTSMIQVPDSGGPYSVGAVLVTTPPPLGSLGMTGVQVAVGGTIKGVRRQVNLIAGANATISAADNPGSNRVDVTIGASGGSSSPAYAFPVASYGAKGDGKIVTDGAMTSGSAILACTTSLPFAAGDAGVNKPIMVKGAGPAGVTTLLTTIQSFTDSGHVVLAATASTTITGATVMWASDDTAAFQGAVNDAVAYAQAHGGYAEVVIPPAAGRFYGIAGALSHANLGNAQITLPVIPVAANTVTLVFKGAESGNALRHWDQAVPQVTGSCLVSFGVYPSIGAQTADINTNGQSAMIGGPTGPNGYGTATYLFSNMNVVMKGLKLLTTHSNFGLGYGGAWLWGVDQADLVDVGCDTTGVFNNGSGELGGSGVSSLSSGASVGIGLPGTSNQNNVTLDRVVIGGGYTYGLLATEHSDLHGCHIFYCWGGLCPVGSWHDGGGVSANTSSHKIRFSQVGIEGCVHDVHILGAGAGGIGPFLEGSIDVEGGLALADDGNGGLVGALGEIHVSGTTGGSVSTSTGTGLTIIDQRNASGPGTPWTLVVGTAFQNTQWRWANVLLAGGTSLTAVQLGNLRGGPSAPTMTNYYTQASGALPPVMVRVPPGGWLKVVGTGSAPTATVVYD